MMYRFMIPRGGPCEVDHVTILMGGRTIKIKRGVEYVVREKGEWRNNKDEYPECTRCGYMPQYDPMIDDIYYSDFCPNCGADMTGGDRNV